MFDYNLGALSEFEYKNSDKSVEAFNRLSAGIFMDDPYLDSQAKNSFYSFDASDIYDTSLIPVVGSHGDLRSYDKSNQFSREKRISTMNFLMNFTKNNFIEILK